MAWEFKSDRPIYTQLLEMIQLKIIAGEYKAGDKLPSVRDLAQEAAVNPNTMQRALTELERLGLVYSQRTNGRTITENVELISNIKEQIAREQIDEFIGTMKKLGYTRDEVITLMEEEHLSTN